MTLPELIVGAGLLVIVLTGLILSYLRAIELQEVAQATSLATKAAVSRLEEIRATTPFSQIKVLYDQVPFDVSGLTAKGVTYINDADAGLLWVTSSISWRQRSGRVYGGDKNLNGQVDVGDGAVNGELQGSVQLKTKVFRK